MCGIWGFIFKNNKKLSVEFRKSLYEAFTKIKDRGPDRGRFQEENNNIFLGFQRLAIIDETINGDQPFIVDNNNKTIYCLCNGELYNHNKLRIKYNIRTKSNSDCEIIPIIYSMLGIDKLLEEIKEGEFACALIEIDNLTKNISIKLFTDPCSVRPLFYINTENYVAFSSLLKGLNFVEDGRKIRRLEPGTILEINLIKDNNYTIKTEYLEKKYYTFNKFIEFEPKSIEKILVNNKFQEILLEYIFNDISRSLIKSVLSMLKSDRPIGALLSGGLDSSLVTSIAAKYLHNHNKILRTFSIGLANGTDEIYAKQVAKYCKTEHTHFEFSTNEFLNALEDVIIATETFDITTIRASTGQYLISKKIKEDTDIKVLLVGDGSDELCSGYMYFHNSPNSLEAHKENCRLLKDIHLFDGLRADRCIAANGIEARMPFLKYTFLETYLKINPDLRVPIYGIEKWLLRKSFERTNYLPHNVLFRKKEAFSDGVSSNEKSWYEIIQQMTESIYSDKEFNLEVQKYEHCKPLTKEALYYRKIYEKHFGTNTDHLIPYYWLPKWSGNILEPSARVLDIYKQKFEK